MNEYEVLLDEYKCENCGDLFVVNDEHKFYDCILCKECNP